MDEKVEYLKQSENKPYQPKLLGSLPWDFTEKESLSQDSPILNAQFPEELEKYLPKNITGFVKYPNPNGTPVFFYYPKNFELRFIELIKDKQKCSQLASSEKERLLIDFMYYWYQAWFTESNQSEKEKKRIDDILKNVENNTVFNSLLEEKAEEIHSDQRKKKLKELFKIPDQKTDSEKINEILFQQNISENLYIQIVKLVLDYYQAQVNNIMKESLNNTRDAMQLIRDCDISLKLNNLLNIIGKNIKFRGWFSNKELEEGDGQLVQIDTNKFFTNENPLKYFEDITPDKLLPQNNQYETERKNNVMLIDPFKVWTFRCEAEKERNGKREWQIQEKKYKQKINNFL
jgi:hypothetical protein